MRPTILHVSDLHRDPKAPLANRPLLESLRLAVENFLANAARGAIDVVVVSGDLVQGIPPDAPVAGLRAQYEEAEELLGALTDALVAGERDRVVIVPGNHDVCFPTFLSSLEAVGVDDGTWSGLLPDLFDRDSLYRWDWKTRALYRIADRTKYQSRLSAFADFYERFYEGRRRFSLDPSDQFDVFDYPALHLTCVGYSSCCFNDPWHTLGHIHSDALAGSFQALRAPRLGPRVLVAVWHHSVSGPPHRPDFMDEERVQVLLANGFSVGLHGHQHRAERVQNSSRFDLKGQVTVVSAGTLCGGARALPPGRPRSFNIIELDAAAGHGQLHVLEMVNDSLDHPIWAPKAPRTATARVFPIQRQPAAPGGLRRERAAELLEAQRLIESGNLEAAKTLLEPLASDDLARRLLLHAALESDDQTLICRVFDPPTSDQEVIHLLHALWDTEARSRLSEVIAEHQANTNPEVAAVVDVMRRKLSL